MVPDESDFGRRVPLVVGTCTISRLINVIHESEIDNLTTPWSTARLARLLSCWLGTVVLGPGGGGVETLEEDTCGGSPEVNVDELVTVQESVCLGLFQTEIRGTCETPPQIYLICDDYSIESRGPTT